MPQGPEYWRISRASKGGMAARKTNRRFYLRKVVGKDEMGRDLLECGHAMHQAQDMIGDYHPTRRRCVYCPKEQNHA